MKKRFLSLLLAISVLSTLITALPITASAASSGTCGANLTWTLDDNGTLTISGTGDMDYWSAKSSVPWYGCKSSINTVVIDDGVTSIGAYAFSNCYSLISVTIPASVTYIGDSAFSSCDSLTSATIPASVTSIGDSAFSSCYRLTSITISDSITSIGDLLFDNCYNLTSITIPASVTSIGDFAFADCYNLTDVYYGGSEVEWSNIDIANGNEDLTSANIHFGSVMPVVPVYQNPENMSGTFQFASGKGNASFTYDDNYFSSSSYSYKSPLSRMSIRLALSAFAKHESGNKYGNQHANVQDLMGKIGFRGFGSRRSAAI